MAPPSSTTAATALHAPKKPQRRRWTRQQLLRNLEMIGDLPVPLPPTLPPSPPASRTASPAPGSKRKLLYSSDSEAVKRPRTSSTSDWPSQPTPPEQSHQSSHQTHYQDVQTLHQTPSIPARQPPSASISVLFRPEPSEDGEVREEQLSATIPITHGSLVDVPVRRPKKGKPTVRHFDALHDTYHSHGRMLKYSGDFRFWSTFPTGHREYKPLPNPPDPSSPYYKHGGLIARLELVDSLICFAYSIWNRDIARRTCFVETWQTIEGFLGWCKQKWQAEEGANDSEKAFLGLIWMVEAFIKGRKIAYTVRSHLDADMDKVVEGASKKISSAAATALGSDSLVSNTLKAPPMLPSPSSANSTPANREDGTPNSANARSSQAAANAAHRQMTYNGSVPFKLLPEQLQTSAAPIPPHVMSAMEATSEPIGPSLVQNLKDLTADLLALAFCLEKAQQTFNLPVLRRCFPRTCSRIMYSTLLPNEEHEPDFEDEEGELYWPDQSISGEGLGWVCLMGKAMIKEFGKAYGYKSVDGVVPKPKPEESQRPAQLRSGPPPIHGATTSSSYRNSVPSVPSR